MSFTVDPVKVDGKQSKTPSRLVTIEPVMFLYSIFYTGSVPLISQFIRHQTQRKYNVTALTAEECLTRSAANLSSSRVVSTEAIQTEAATWLVYMVITSYVPGFVSTIFLGGYSDRAGRKTAIVPPIVGGMLRFIIFIIVFMFDLPVGFLLIAEFVNGISGGQLVLFMSVYSYMSDVTNVKNRSFRIVLLEGCLGIARVVANLLVGFLISGLGYLWTFSVLLGVLILTLFYSIFLLPETIVPTEHVKFWTLKYFKESVRIYTNDDGSGRAWKLRYTLVLFAIWSGVQFGSFDVQTLLFLAPPLCFPPTLIGYFYTFFGLITRIAQVLSTRFLGPRIGDLGLVILGGVSGTVLCVMLAFSTTKIVTFMVPLAGTFASLHLPVLQSINSKLVLSAEMGAMFATMAWAQMISILVGQVSQNAIYAATVATWQYTVFITDAATGAVFVILAIAFAFLCRNEQSKKCKPSNIPGDLVICSVEKTAL